jgi:hydroxymethylglutaryl-CoA synthase
MAAPGSALEHNLGDGAAAFLVGERDVIAEFEDAFTLSEEIVDVWRADGDRFSHSWEDRFVVQQGYAPRIAEAVAGLLEKSGRRIDDYAAVALYGPDARAHKGAVRALGLKAEQTQEAFFGRLGNAGAAFAPLQLAAALEAAKPGERLLVANYGDGADAIGLRVGGAIEKLSPRKGVAHHLARRRSVGSYAKYLRARDLETSEWEAGSDPGLSATIHFRERDDDLSFRAQQCRACNAVQFPAQRLCESCFAKDDFTTLRLSDRVGHVVTYTFDYFFPTPDPPTAVTIVDVEGARIHLQLVDCPPEQLTLGMPVEFVFRCIHRGGGRPNYYWKGTPRESAERSQSDGD